MDTGQTPLSASGASLRQGDLFSGAPAAAGQRPSPSTVRLRSRKTPPQPCPDLDKTIHKVLDRELKELPTEPDEPLIEGFAEADWLPARMLNEFVYCPRLFFYEHIDGIFVHNADTERGKDIHSRVDKGTGALPAPAEGDDAAASIHSRSVQMGSARLGVTAKLDLVESGAADSEVAPVDYKAGAPKEGVETRELWPADRMQLGLQMLILRENGYACSQGFIYYRETKQRVALAWSPDLEVWITDQIAQARALLRSRSRPEPLEDSPKCPRCSLVSVCLPDETRFLHPPKNPDSTKPPRRLIAARTDARALYLNTQGVRVGLKDRVLDVKEKDRSIEQIRLADVDHVALFGNIQISTQTVRELCQMEIPVTYFSLGGWFYGLTRGHSLANVLLRRAQFRVTDGVALDLARHFVSGKIRNARKMLMRNALVQPEAALLRLKRAAHDALEAPSTASLLGVEGAAAAVYFSEFGGMIKTDDDDLPGLESPTPDAPLLRFDFQGRNRRPPTDPVNALLSLAYSLLVKDCTVALLAVGFDPWMGFYHQPRPGRPSLALDLMEEFRPLIAESAVLTAINTRMVGPLDFVRAGNAVNLSPTGRKRFFHAYETRMNHLIVHPVFDYKVSYRRALELQARLLARVLEGEIPHYIPFLTR